MASSDTSKCLLLCNKLSGTEFWRFGLDLVDRDGHFCSSCTCLCILSSLKRPTLISEAEGLDVMGHIHIHKIMMQLVERIWAVR
jgi:hypothetical protein